MDSSEHLKVFALKNDEGLLAPWGPLKVGGQLSGELSEYNGMVKLFNDKHVEIVEQKHMMYVMTLRRQSVKAARMVAVDLRSGKTLIDDTQYVPARLLETSPWIQRLAANEETVYAILGKDVYAWRVATAEKLWKRCLCLESRHVHVTAWINVYPTSVVCNTKYVCCLVEDFADCCHGRIHALCPSTGQQLWQTQGQPIYSPKLFLDNSAVSWCDQFPDDEDYPDHSSCMLSWTIGAADNAKVHPLDAAQVVDASLACSGNGIVFACAIPDRLSGRFQVFAVRMESCNEVWHNEFQCIGHIATCITVDNKLLVSIYEQQKPLTMQMIDEDNWSPATRVFGECEVLLVGAETGDLIQVIKADANCTSLLVVKYQNAQVNESGVTRVQCRHIASDVIGWVTMKGNQGTVYFEPCAEYGSFLASMDTIMVATASSANKVATLVMAPSNADVQAMSSWA